MRQVAQHLGVGALELRLDGMRRADAEVIVAEADVGIGIGSTQLRTDLLDDGLHRLEVLAVHDEFAVVAAAYVHRTHQAVAHRRRAHRCSHAVNSRILQQRLAYLQEVLSHTVGAGLVGQMVFDDKLSVVEVGEEDLLHLEEAESADCQQGEHNADGKVAIVDETAYQSTDRCLQLRVLHFAAARLLLCTQRHPSHHARGHLHHCHHPRGQQRDAEHQEEVATVLACRALGDIGGEERQHGNHRGTQHGQSRIAYYII